MNVCTSLDTSNTRTNSDSNNINVKRKKLLLFGIAGVILLCGVILSVFFFVDTHPLPLSASSSDGEKFNSTFLLSALDKTVRPCDDFYQFACGNWLKTAKIPSTRSSVDTSFYPINEQNEKVVRQILDEKWPLLGEFYDSCMNTTYLEALAHEPLTPFLQQIDRLDTTEQLHELLGTYTRIGFDFITGVGVYADFKNPNLNVLHVSQGGLSLPDREYYLDKVKFAKLETAFREMISSFFILSGIVAKDNTATLKQYETTIINFETQIAKFTIPKDELRDPSKLNNPMTLKESSRSSPALINSFLKGANLGLNDSTSFIVHTPRFFERVGAWLDKSIDLDTLKTVLKFQLITYFSGSLSSNFVNARFNFFGKKLYGLSKMKPRWKICVQSTQSRLGELVGRYYVQHAFKGSSTDIIHGIVKDIERAMSLKLNEITWMDAPTRNAASKKLSMISNLVGHPTKYLSYPIVLNPTSYLANKVKLIKLYSDKVLARLGQPVDRSIWQMESYQVNAYYSPSTNQIVFPAGIMQPPFFHETFPPAMNFGGIGMVIGHELTHGFDDSGRKYSGDGRLLPWWTNSTKSSFESRAKCLVKQYNAFRVVNKESGEKVGHINGELTLGENIADNGGLKLAFEAYQNFKQQHSVKKLEIANFNDNQLFFLSFAQSWCSKSTQEAEQNQLLTDEHSPSKWRINGAVMNNAYFADAFKCKNNSPMNPSRKCVLW